MKKNLATELTDAWGHAVGGVAGGLFLVGGLIFFGFGAWALICLLDWSQPDWTKVGVLLMGPILIGSVLLWAAWSLFSNARKHFHRTRTQ